ncbi:MAG: hypothetical protein GX838_02285 [Clostridiaceae bacterium]|nr:hypothetical protein [Clostridiaceae bacterium]
MRDKFKRMIRAWVSFLNKRADAVMTRAMVWSIRSGSRKEFKNRRCGISREQKQAIQSYWRRYTKKNRPLFQALYACMHGAFDVRYLPDDLYLTRMIGYLNDRDYAVLTNKCLQPLLFNCRQPETVFMRIKGSFYNADYQLISREEAIRLFLECGEAVVKPATRTHSGKGIQFYAAVNAAELSDFLDTHFGQIPSYIVQKIVKQHTALAAIHESSVNCLRVMTLLIDGQAVALSTVLKMGAGGSQVDNLGFGGIVCGVREDGRLREVAFSANGDRFDRHPQGFDFSGYLVPSFQAVKELAMKMAERLPYSRLIAWDIAVAEDGEPVLIEYNDIGELGFMQYANGPLFGDYTDQVLSEIFL